jgi:protein-S-isoprenylcysteine O-methyltransferase Ste14
MNTLIQIIPWIILTCWAALIITWIVTSIGVKRDINRGAWWRFWWVRIIVIVVAASVALHAAGLGGLKYHFGFVSPIAPNVPLATLAVILCVFGVALAIWARLHLGRNWSPAPNLKEGHELITSGPYKIIRHPIYTGILMAMLGSALVSPPWLIAFVIFGCMFVWRVKKEEDLLMKQFPNQYPEYKKQTWALVPYIW